MCLEDSGFLFSWLILVVCFYLTFYLTHWLPAHIHLYANQKWHCCPLVAQFICSSAPLKTQLTSIDISGSQ